MQLPWPDAAAATLILSACVRYKEDLGSAVVNFARHVPDGLLVFFPSYAVMNACLEYWRGNLGGEAP